MLRRAWRLLVVGVVMLLLMEGGVRLIFYARDGAWRGDKSFDSELGWTATPSHHPKPRRFRDLVGRQYERRYSTDERGSRLWGTAPGRPKILFIGDSYTQAVEVSNDATYYSRFAVLSGLDTYELGVGGFGTLQEEELMARTLRASNLRPDILVLQFCSNDWINNSAELEGEWIFLDQRTRPYRAIDGRIIRTLGNSSLLMHTLEYSRLASALLRAGEVLFVKATGRFRFDRIPAVRRSAAERDAVSITAAELQELRALVPRAHAYAFNCEETNLGFETFRQEDEFVRVARSAGFVPLVGVQPFVEGGTSGSRGVRSADGGHYNEEGHRRMADFLFRQICANEPCAKAPSFN